MLPGLLLLLVYILQFLRLSLRRVFVFRTPKVWLAWRWPLIMLAALRFHVSNSTNNNNNNYLKASTVTSQHVGVNYFVSLLGSLELLHCVRVFV